MLITGENVASFACLHKAVNNGHGHTEDIDHTLIPVG